ncbi:MAG: hypothetical protein C0617_12130 [Desulfuromonas sp.]|uniref:hypothetical protein n=1 Tax=Desulfuromonas sp. TaxID=892 RepID=UPI000CBFA8A8|nr:hypothetical protein [Desulfuromonas sp.]PLX83273.1 MAG: hypothetical protein C0617_12130 [Desulfuromonas sp.]
MRSAILTMLSLSIFAGKFDPAAIATAGANLVKSVLEITVETMDLPSKIPRQTFTQLNQSKTPEPYVSYCEAAEDAEVAFASFYQGGGLDLKGFYTDL